MKIFLFLAVFLLLVSCGEDKDAPPKRFIDTYKEVLVIREMYPLDTATANRKVDSVFKENNYTEPEFRQDFFKYSRKNEEFVNTIDSLRESIKFEQDTLRRQEKD